MPGIENKTDAQWDAECDARTLSTANIILNDDKRWNAAKKAAANLAKETSDELNGLLKIAGKASKVEGMKVIGKAD